MLSYGQVGFVAVSMLFLLQIVTGLNLHHRLTQSQDSAQSAAEQEYAHLLQRYPEQQILDRNKRFPKFLVSELSIVFILKVFMKPCEVVIKHPAEYKTHLFLLKQFCFYFFQLLYIQVVKRYSDIYVKGVNGIII